MKIGDIILIPYPFAELSNRKIRPAVVIAETSDKYKDLVVSAISSVIPDKLSSRELILNHGGYNHLRVNSVIKVDRIVTLKREDKLANMGKLSPFELNEFKAILRDMIK
jgi:mRNA interferase MazF